MLPGCNLTPGRAQRPMVEGGEQCAGTGMSGLGSEECTRPLLGPGPCSLGVSRKVKAGRAVSLYGWIGRIVSTLQVFLFF